jgi:hypothetical protein
MMDELSRSASVSAQADRFGAALGRSGMADERASGHRARCEQARAQLGAYQRAVADAYVELRVSPESRLRLQAVANRTYRLARRYKGERLYLSLAESVCDRLIEGSRWVETMAVVEGASPSFGMSRLR